MCTRHWEWLIGRCDNTICRLFPDLSTGLLLLLLEEGEEADTGHLGDLETHAGNITLGVAGATETSDKNLVVLIDEVKATVVGHEGSDLLTVLDKLHTHALTHSGVGLLRLDTDLLKNDPLGVGAAGERLGPLLAQVATLVALVRPVVDAALGTQLATGAKSVGLTCLCTTLVSYTASSSSSRMRKNTRSRIPTTPEDSTARLYPH